MEPTTADAILVFGKTLATRPAVMDGLLRLSKTYKHSLADMHSVWLRTADKESPGEDQENAGSLLNAVSVSATAPKDLPSLKDVTALEKYYARCVLRPFSLGFH